jgi:peptidoglycan/LPS O-acetylase OafA/YrhL
MKPADVPRPVRAAGVLVLLQGVTGVAVGGWLLIAAVRGSTGPGPIGATAAWLLGFGVILFTVGVNLVRGRHGARTPAIVAQLLLLGVCWYAIGPSSQPLYGVPAGVFCLAVLLLLFSASARRWAADAHSATR